MKQGAPLIGRLGAVIGQSGERSGETFCGQRFKGQASPSGLARRTHATACRADPWTEKNRGFDRRSNGTPGFCAQWLPL